MDYEKQLQSAFSDREHGHIIFFDSITSTNEYAVKSAEENLSVIIANMQTNGRGRAGKSFFSPPDCGIYLTYIFDVDMNSKYFSLLTSLCAIAVHDVLKRVCGIESAIKWPNDIFVNGRKLCGILTQLVRLGDRQTAIIGIGLNVCQSYDDFPAEIRDIAISLKTVTGKDKERYILCREIVRELDKILVLENALCSDVKKYIEKLNSLSYVKGKPVIIESRSITGVAQEIDESGALIIHSKDGYFKVDSGEIMLMASCKMKCPRE